MAPAGQAVQASTRHPQLQLLELHQRAAGRRAPPPPCMPGGSCASCRSCSRAAVQRAGRHHLPCPASSSRRQLSSARRWWFVSRRDRWQGGRARPRLQGRPGIATTQIPVLAPCQVMQRTCPSASPAMAPLHPPGAACLAGHNLIATVIDGSREAAEDGQLIRPDVSADLDELRQAYHSLPDYLTQLVGPGCAGTPGRSRDVSSLRLIPGPCCIEASCNIDCVHAGNCLFKTRGPAACCLLHQAEHAATASCSCLAGGG